MNNQVVTIIGGGFAGVECAHFLAEKGIKVELYEMRPVKMTEAHQTDQLSELVCSNSFKSRDPETPAGLLKSEMVAMGSLVIPTGEKHSVPGGSALAVNRVEYAKEITKTIENHPNITLLRKEFTSKQANEILESNNILVLATGPLTSEGLGAWLTNKTGRDHLYFYDAVSPTVDASTINEDKVFAQSRYDKGGGNDYLNCPMNQEEYKAFVTALIEAEQVPLKDFEKPKYFEGCKPIEEIAKKGHDSLRFGNFKPVGLTDPKTGRWPYAAVQLRPENKEKTLYSLVACQNRLKWGVQKEVLQMIPGLEEADFVRLGVIHRNTYIESPQVLDEFLAFKEFPNLYIAGQLTGVEGYVESAAMGIYAGLCIWKKLSREPFSKPPRTTAYGSLISHLQDQTEREFAPMNINWGILPNHPTMPRKKDERRAWKLERARKDFTQYLSEVGLNSC